MFDYHMPSALSFDGHSSPEEMVRAAEAAFFSQFQAFPAVKGLRYFVAFVHQFQLGEPGDLFFVFNEQNLSCHDFCVSLLSEIVLLPESSYFWKPSYLVNSCLMLSAASAALSQA